MTDHLPHDEYMAAVARELTAYGIEPERWWAAEDDSGAETDQLNGVFQWGDGVVDPEHWPHGVYLTWDQYDGWRLIEEGDNRNIYPLSEDSGVTSHPRQIAADVKARLTHGLDGWSPGPICIADGSGYWDAKAFQEAITAWPAMA